MVERATARAGMEALVAAIAEMTESAQDLAVRPLPGGAKGRRTTVAALRCFGEDVALLAAAMEVLQRRAT